MKKRLGEFCMGVVLSVAVITFIMLSILVCLAIVIFNAVVSKKKPVNFL